LNLGIENAADELADKGRPSKRRKVEGPTDSFDEVVSDLHFLLKAQKAADLSGLSQIAEQVFSHTTEGRTNILKIPLFYSKRE
jgi:hypothetical protein